ncbi:type IV pilus assembly protein PilM [Patescibacteria group bacterium]|nr:type IV pilus assembly protein PilM [Patescibacteria group bacterium]
MFQDIRGFFKLRPKKFLGIDIGTSSIKIVEMGRQGKSRRLENYGEIKTSSFKKRRFRVFQKNTLSLSNREVAKAIQAVCKETGIQTKEVSFSIPDFCSFFTGFKLPVMGKDEIPQAVKYEVRPYIPLPLPDVTLDWSITEGEVSKTPLKVLVAAIPNDIINQYQQIAHFANLKLRILESEVFALVRALTKKNEKEKKAIGLIDIGARSTTCSVLEQGILKTSYSFNVAGNELTEIIAKSLNIDYNEAEEMKRKHGLLFKNGLEESQRNIRKILLPLIDSILEEIKKAFRNFYRDEGKEVGKIILAGGLTSMPGLKEYFSTELKKELDIADPFFNIACPVVLTNTLKEIGPSYAISVGLTLKGLE